MSNDGTKYELELGLKTGVAKRDVDDVTGSLFRAGDAADRVAAKANGGAASTVRFSSATRGAAASAASATASYDRMGASVTKVDGAISRTVKNVLALGVAWLSLSAGVAVLKDVVLGFTETESALVAVTKTTGIAGGELKALYKDVTALSTGSVPLLTKDLLEISSAAGSLGVSGSENILRYTETIGKLTAASEDLKGEEAATLLTQMMNVQGEGPERIDRLASVIIGLGLNSATTERQIARVALEVSKATAPFKLGSTIVAAYGAAMAEVKIQAELGGSAIGRTFREMQKAVSEGGTALDRFADVAGVSAEEFRQTFEASPNEGFLFFLRGLSAYGRDAGVVLEKLGLSGDELAKVLPTLAENYGSLTAKIQQANEEAASGAALNEKAAAVFDSTGSDLTRLENAYREVKDEIGSGMSPALREVTADLLAFVNGQGEAANALGQDLGEVLRALADLLLLAARHVDVLKVALLVLLALKVVLWIEALAAGLFRGIAALAAYRASTTAASASTGIFAGTVVSLGRTVSTVSPVLNAYGQQIVTTTTQMNAATVASSRFLTAGITPLAAGLAILAGALLYTAGRFSDFAEQWQRDIDVLVEENNRFADSIQRIKREADTLTSIFDEAAEYQKRLLAAGVKDPNSDQAEQIRQQVALEFQRKRVDVLVEQTAALGKAKTALEEHGKELDRLREKEKDLLEQQAARSRQEEARPTQGGGLGSASGIGGGAAAAARDYAAELENVRGKIQDAEIAVKRAGIEVTTLTKTTAELTRETAAYEAPAEKASRAAGDLGGEVDKQTQAFERSRTSLGAEINALERLAAAYSGSDSERRRVLTDLEIEKRWRAEAAQMTEAQALALKPLIRDQVLAEQSARGAATISGLEGQIKAAERLSDALDLGAAAAETVAAEEEVLAAASENAADAHEDQAGEIERLTRRLGELDRKNAFKTQKQQIEESNRALRDASSSWDGTVVSIEKASIALQINNEITQATIGLTQTEAEEIGHLIRERERLEAVFEARLRLGRIEEETHRMQELSRVVRDNFRTEREYQRALRAVNVEHEVRSALLSVEFNRLQAIAAITSDSTLTEEARAQLLADVNAEFTGIATRTEAAIRSQAALNEQMLVTERTAKTTTGKWLLLADAMDGGLAGGDQQLQQIASGLATVIRGIVEATEAVNSFGAAQGWAMAVQGALAIAQAVGLLDQNVTAGGFGGRGEGNYAAEGSLVGGVIGGIIGALTPVGAQAGYAIGSAVGGIAGSFVKKGADEAIAAMDWTTTGFVATLYKNEANLGQALNDLGNRINDALYGLIDAIGAAADDLPNVGLKVRDGVISATVGAVRARFREMDDAIAFVVTELLKQGDFTGLSDTIRTVLENTDATSIDQLGRDLEFGQWYERLGFEDAAVALLEKMAEFRIKFRQAVELGLDTKPVTEWLVGQIGDIRSSILGIEEKPEERIRRQAEAFNQQVDLLRAEQQARKADLLVKRAQLVADIALLQAEIGVGQARLAARGGFLDADTLIMLAELEVLQTALAAVDEALKAVDILMEALGEDLKITEEEIQRAIARARRAGSGAGGSDREQFDRELESIARGALPDAVRGVLELGDRLRDLDAQAKELKASEADLARARQTLIDQQKNKILDPVRPFLSPADGGTFGLTEWETEQAEIRQTFDEARAANRALIDETGQRAIAFWKLNEAELRALNALAERAVDSLDLPMEATRDRVRQLGDTVRFLQESVAAGVISLERFEEVMTELGEQATIELLEMTANLLEQMGRFDEADSLRREIDELNFHIQRAQLNFLFQQYVALGLITGEVADRLQGLLNYINDPKNWPDFTKPPPSRPSANAARSSNAESSEPEWIKVRDEIAKQVETWRDSGLKAMIKEARDLRARYDELVTAARRWRLSTTELDAAFQVALGAFVDEALESFENLGESPLAQELRELQEKFAEIAEAFRTVGAGAEAMARLETAHAAALADFWERATEPLRGLLDELRAADPRRSGEQNFRNAQDDFRELAARAAAGDLSALEQLEAAARAYQEQTAAFLGGGVGSGVVLDEITSVLEALTGSNPFGAAADPMVDRMDMGNDLLRQILETIRGGSIPRSAPAAPAAASPAAAPVSRNVQAAAQAEPRAAAVTGLSAGTSPADRPAPTVLVVGGSTADPAMVAALRQIAETERRKQEAAQQEARMRAAADTQEAADRAKLQESIDKLASAVGTLIRVIENRGPAGLS